MSTIVLGAGYAGVLAANRLSGRGEPVTLVTPHSWFVERIRLHAVAAGARPDARRDLSSLLHPGVKVVTDAATRIDFDVVHLASEGELPYQTLVCAVGSGAPGGPGMHRVASEPEAERLRDDLADRPDAPVTIVGAGLSGIELAGALRAAGRRVRLFADEQPTRRAARAHLAELARRGVTVEFGRHGAQGQRGDEMTVDATGLRVPTLAADSGSPTDESGRLLVDAHLTVPGHPRIVGAGDAVRVTGPTGQHLRPACATAMPMGAHAADVVLARKHHAEEVPFAMGYLLQCVDLGAGSGRAQFVHPDDSERPFAVTGRSGGLLKEAVCRLTVRWLAREGVRPGSYTWPAGPRTAATE